MKFRARVAVVATLVLVLVGAGSAANAGSARNLGVTPTSPSSAATNGCVLVEPVQLGVCLARLN